MWQPAFHYYDETHGTIDLLIRKVLVHSCWQCCLGMLPGLGEALARRDSFEQNIRYASIWPTTFSDLGAQLGLLPPPPHS